MNVSTTTTASLPDASAAWVNALSEAAARLNLAAADLQEEWNQENAVEQDGTNGLEPLPDPIKLLRRINALEHSVQALRQDCSDMMARRQVAVLEAVTQLDSLRDLFQNENLALASLEKDDRALQELSRLEDVVAQEFVRFQDAAAPDESLP